MTKWIEVTDDNETKTLLNVDTGVRIYAGPDEDGKDATCTLETERDVFTFVAKYESVRAVVGPAAIS